MNEVCVLSMMSANIAGYTKKVTVSAIFFIAWCTAQAVAPQMFIPSEAPVYATAFLGASCCFGLCVIFPFFWQAYVIWENRRRDRLLADDGSAALVGDEFFDLTDREQQLRFRYVY